MNKTEEEWLSERFPQEPPAGTFQSPENMDHTTSSFEYQLKERGSFSKKERKEIKYFCKPKCIIVGEYDSVNTIVWGP